MGRVESFLPVSVNRDADSAGIGFFYWRVTLPRGWKPARGAQLSIRGAAMDAGQSLGQAAIRESSAGKVPTHPADDIGTRDERPSLISGKVWSIGWALGDQAIVSGASFLTTIIVARLLGVEEFGRFAIAWLIVLLFQNLHSAAIVGPLITIGAIWPEENRAPYLGALLQQQLVFSAVAAVIVYGGVVASGHWAPGWGLGQLALPIGLMVAAGPLAELVRGDCYAMSRPRNSFQISSLRYAIQLGLLLALLAWEPHWASVSAVLYIAAGAAAFAGLAGVLRWSRVQWSVSAFVLVTKRHWTFSRWLLGSSALVTSRELFANVAVGAVLGLADVGLLRAAQQIVFVVNIPLQGLGRLATAYASRAFSEGGFEGLWRFSRGFVLPYMLGIAALLILIALASPLLVSLVFGAAYAGAVPLLTAFALIMLLYLGRDIFFIVSRALQKTAWECLACLAGAVVSVPLLIPLIDVFGIAGALAGEAIYLAASLVTAGALVRAKGRRPTA